MTSSGMQIHEQNAGLAKDSKVLEVGLDQVYNFSTETPHKGTDGLCFRFMPDAEEVQQALQVCACPCTDLMPLVAQQLFVHSQTQGKVIEVDLLGAWHRQQLSC